MQQNNRRVRAVVRRRISSPSTSGTSLASLDQTAIYSDYLQHFGILGMKWGIRRYQNEDGTLTEEGKQRYSNADEFETKNWKKSDARNLSDDELNRRNSRLQREKQYKDLTTSDSERERNQFKKDLIKKALLLPLAGIAAYAGTKLIKNYGTKMVDMFEKYGKKAVSKIKSNGLLKQAANRGHSKYERAFSEGLREYFPRKNGGYGERMYNYRPRINNAMPRQREWPNNW